MMARYSIRRDPYWTTAKYPGKDMHGAPVAKGDRIWVYPAHGSNSARILTGAAAEQAALDFQAALDDERINETLHVM